MNKMETEAHGAARDSKPLDQEIHPRYITSLERALVSSDII